MKINWFPGHMTKALRTMEKEIKNIDVVIYVLDSRAPFACLNPEFDKLIVNKPVLIVLNKIDIADVEKIASNDIEEKIKNHFKTKVEIIKLDSTASGALKIIAGRINQLCSDKIEKNRLKNLNSFIRAMVIGVPNCGKSTLVNNLCGRGKAITGNKPGVTRGKQWVSVSKNVQLLDTPGTLYPDLSKEAYAKYLAYIGSIRDEVLDVNELACFLIDDLEAQYPNCLEKRYGISLEGLNYEKLEKIAVSKKFLLKGGEVDYDRACAMLLDDFRKNRLGMISFI